MQVWSNALDVQRLCAKLRNGAVPAAQLRLVPIPVRRVHSYRGLDRVDNSGRHRSHAPGSTGKVDSSSLALLGDALWAMYVRNKYIWPPKHIRLLHNLVDKHITAEMQAIYYDRLLVSEGILVDAELSVMRKAYNDPTLQFRARFKDLEKKEQYRKATAFEALIGHLHVSEDRQRAEQVIQTILAFLDEQP
eukprot:gene26252-17352_t